MTNRNPLSQTRRIAFVLAATDHGMMIVNRMDMCVVDTPEGQKAFGVGLSLLEQSNYELDEVVLCMKLLDERRKHFGDGVNVIDGGANIGTYTLPLARHMTGWGEVCAIEAQERVFYALCGNIAINNCMNAWANNKVLSGAYGLTLTMPVPELDHSKPASFGSVEVVPSLIKEEIGQDVNSVLLSEVEIVCIDQITDGHRVDLIKLDIEGMEMSALLGALGCIEQHHPILLIEWVKSDREELVSFLESNNYVWFLKERNILAVHKNDPTLQFVESGI